VPSAIDAGGSQDFIRQIGMSVSHGAQQDNRADERRQGDNRRLTLTACARRKYALDEPYIALKPICKRPLRADCLASNVNRQAASRTTAGGLITVFT